MHAALGLGGVAAAAHVGRGRGPAGNLGTAAHLAIPPPPSWAGCGSGKQCRKTQQTRANRAGNGPDRGLSSYCFGAHSRRGRGPTATARRGDAAGQPIEAQTLRYMGLPGQYVLSPGSKVM
ncbi:hypothetical protein CC78DRAFT_579367 [Lojkania enalia]|uniref:Uncharacterized protein n=1 Tax=Lojkania enalia TaxID=147567 RepID=A0A9P4KFA4_9PLEO|nr:hypothetical protein CC78DRAFT_579367 [Didymosphaeria enalia]